MTESETADQFSRAVKDMAEGDVILICLIGDTPEDHKYELRFLTMEKLISVFEKIGTGVIAGAASLVMRPGTALYWVTLEHTWFSPNDPDEALFTSAMTRWRGEIWTLGFVPTSLSWTLDEAARLTGMRLAMGCPGVIDNEGLHEFPLPWVRNLENDITAPIYKTSEDTLRLGAQGCISSQEAIRRITTAERAMYRAETEAIRKVYQAKGLDPDS